MSQMSLTRVVVFFKLSCEVIASLATTKVNDVTAFVEGLQLAALRGRQGDRTVYQAMVPNSVLNNFFTVNMDPPAEKSQRSLSAPHAKDIAEYILANPDEYVLGTLTYAVDQECHFAPSDLHQAMGVLTIPFGTNLRSLDGQHRRAGLNDAIAEDPALGDEHTAVLIYVEPDVTRRRQMFSDMNATPKVVAKAVNVAFDSRDPFARAAQRIVECHPLLDGVVDLEASRVAPSSAKWFTLGSIHDALKRLQVGPSGRVRVPQQYQEDAIIGRGSDFFTLLGDARPEFAQVRAGLDISVVRSKSIIFSSTTLRALAGAVHQVMSGSAGPVEMADLVGGLAKIDFAPSAPMWVDAGFVSPGKTTPNARAQEVLAATKAIAHAIAPLSS